MEMGVKVKVWGNYALFSRPELKVERCSYNVVDSYQALFDRVMK